MKVFRRISATINAQINALIDEMENHEAVADLALSDIRESLLRAKYQIHRVQNEQRSLGEKLKNMYASEKLWSERAVSTKESDRTKALDCVRRLRRTREGIDAAKRQLDANEDLERKLTEDVYSIENKFDELKRKRSELAARESRARALVTVNQHQAVSDVGGVFERWEQKVMHGEAHGEFGFEARDSLDEKFSAEEEREQLEEILGEISAAQNPNNRKEEE